MVKCAKCGHKWREFPPEDAPKKVDAPEVEAPAAPEPAQSDAPAAGMSIEEMTQANKPRPRPRPQPEKKKRSWLGWLIFLLVLGGIGAGGYYGRDFVVQVMPGMAGLYHKFKIEVKTNNPLGLELRNMANSSVVDKGVTRLTITGDITNITSVDRPVPRIAIRLVDSEDQLVYSWTIKPDIESVGPWETKTFSTTMNQPPEAAKHVKAHLVVPRKTGEEAGNSQDTNTGSGKETHN